MLLGRTTKDRFDQVMSRATHAHRKPAPKLAGHAARRETREELRERRQFCSWLATFLGRPAR